MYINPFLAGILLTIILEIIGFCAFVFYGIAKENKKKGK